MSAQDDVRLALRRIQMGQRPDKRDVAILAAASDEWLARYDLLSSLAPHAEDSELEDSVGVAVMGYLQARREDSEPITAPAVGRAALGPVRLRGGYFTGDPS